ncbi:MAG: LPS assembly protein LptD [Gammaproteobacteria bacterium]|nr:LPS assembly protein LptD [Gammaproteobacteria bacterium]
MNPHRSIFAVLLLPAILALGFVPLPSRAADPQWQCRPNAAGTGWDCSQPASPGNPPATASGATQTGAPPSDPIQPAAPAAPTPAQETKTPPAATAPVDNRAGYSPWALCGSAPTPALVIPPAPSLGANARNAPAHLSADSAEIRNKNVYLLKGDVRIRRADQNLDADQATYDQARNFVQAQGNVRFQGQGFGVDSSGGHMNLGTYRGEFDNAHYRVYVRHARGSAKTVHIENRNVARLSQATYTTCNPGHEDWLLRADKVTLDRATGEGTARDATLAFKGVPFAYFPYLSFPIDNRRKSGFLLPTIGSSSGTGLDLSTPYYWNIAPNRDATFTPRIMTKRGVLFGAQYRYLHPTSRGEIDAAYLPHDKIYGKSRGLFSYEENGNPAPGWSTNVNYNYVSDSQYFQDLGTNLSLASTTTLVRNATLAYTAPFWSASALVQSFQTVDPTIPPSARPYAMLPQLLLNADVPDQFLGLSYHLRGELVNFQRSDSVTGARLDMEPGISLPMVHPGYFLTPSLALRYTGYALKNQTPGLLDNPSRTLPITRVDSGLYFDRSVHWAGTSLIQTLEPRLFYLYIPYRNQDNLPVFDTSVPDFNFVQMFRDNRFVGADRVGDANQVTLALTSRLLRPDTGAELLRASVGQIYYFHRQRVTLPGVPAATGKSSDLVGEVTAQLVRSWSVSAGAQWNTQQRKTDKDLLQLRYQPDPDRVVNLAYRFQQNLLKEADLSLLWPLTPRWRIVASWNYSLLTKQNLETLAGVEYQSCCWAVRVVGRRYVNIPSGTYNNAIYVQLDLKGLTNIGQKVGTLLEQHGIVGF